MTQKTVTLSAAQWVAIQEMINLGTSYDCDGCDTSTAEERSDADKLTMTAVRALAEQLASAAQPSYTVFKDVAYEGMYNVFSGTEAEIEEWFRAGGHGCSLNDLEIYGNSAPDVYELHAKATSQ